MAARFSTKIRSFIASGLIDNMSTVQYQLWQTLLAYSEGDIVYYGNNKYVCKTSGISGANPPIHISGSQTDGGIPWIYIGQIDTGEMFKRNMFIGIGKPTVWSDEEVPDDAGVLDINEYDTMQNIITLKKITSNNFRLSCRNYQWQSGLVYSQYDSNMDPLAVIGPKAYTYPFYVITDDNNIYKCINNNNNSPSTSKPNSTGILSFSTVDGYVWKYMASLDIDSTFFKTNEFFPVRYKLFNDTSNQWNTQENAVSQSLSTFKVLQKTGTFPGNVTITIQGGSPLVPATAYITKNNDNTLNQILVTPDSVGTGYNYNERVVSLVQRQDAVGSGATVGTITVVAGVITGITIDSAGTGYSAGAILIINDLNGLPTTNASVSVVVSGGNDSIQEFTIVDGGSGYSQNIEAYVIPGNSGALGEAIFASKEGHGYNVITELGVNSAIINLRLSDIGDYFQIGENYAFRQVVLITDVEDKDTNQTAYNELYIGPSHPEYALGSINKIDDNKGYILYLNNLKKVIRSEGQEEDISIVLTF